MEAWGFPGILHIESKRVELNRRRKDMATTWPTHGNPFLSLTLRIHQVPYAILGSRRFPPLGYYKDGQSK